MTIFQIKVIAILSMVIDHIGLFFYPNLIVPRMIGRLAFPLFAWLIANGAYHTKSINSYLKRLFLFSLISQAPFYYSNKLINPNFNQLNVMFTLFIGLFAIKLIKENKSKYKWSLIIAVSAFVGHVLNVDYGAIGVLSIIFFYIYFKNKKMLILSQVIIYLLQPLYRIIEYPRVDVGNIPLYYIYYTPFVLSTLILIFAYNNVQGRKMKYFFYLLYPLQFVLFYLLKVI
jgi:hypothetical protein